MGPGRRFLLLLVLILMVVAKRGVCLHTDWPVSATGQSANTAVPTPGQTANISLFTTGQSANTAVSTTGQPANITTGQSAKTAGAKTPHTRTKRDGTENVPCPADRPWKCDNGACIDSGWLCDVHDDCGDDSDEKNCQNFKCPDDRSWKCDNGKCIKSFKQCDGRDDCGDGSDEKNCQSVPCPKYYQWRCENDNCVHIDFEVCNGIDDCGDGSDERNCQNFTCDELRPWKCENGACIFISSLCNGRDDCGDGSDENCQNLTCPDRRPWKCDNGRCISDSKNLCDGRDDCGDDSDERNCQNFTCPTRRPFKCDNELCIGSYRLCDGFDHCGDGSDERNCHNFTCPTRKPWKCDNGVCLDSFLHCDGDDHCGDGSDERNCHNLTCTVDRPWRCDNGACVDILRPCNGYDDCGDGSDENCQNLPCPGDRPWKCDNGVCTKPCDGRDDCSDGSDERNCQNMTCPDNRPWKCDDGLCISVSSLCDGYRGCHDASDERNCPRPFCETGQFRCKNGRCVSVHFTCDEVDGCGDDSDEVGCSQRAIDQWPYKPTIWPFEVTWLSSTVSFGKNCPHSARVHSDRKALDWTGDGNYSYCQWLMLANFRLGVVVHVKQIRLRLGLTRPKDAVLRVHFDGHAQTYYGDSLDDPVFITDRGPVWFELVSYGHTSVEEAGSVSMSMAYIPYPRHTLPPALEAGVYNCSPPYSVPPELQCDGFVQCLQAEDELDNNCNYTRVGCQKGWIAAGSLCLKFVFPQTTISPDVARQECADRYQAELGSLPHPGTRRLAASLLVRNGHDKLITGLERARVSTPGLRHLYRFLWQWPHAGTEFDGPPTDSSTYSMECSTLDSGQHVLPVPCNDSIRSGFVCSRINTGQNPPAERKYLELEPPTTVQFRQPLKQCDAGHSVHLFHPCSPDAVADMSAAQLPLMSCRNGRRVHYTLVCDGYDDCGDGSDEIKCQDVEEDLLKSSFTCTRQTELVDSKLHCNGVPDCHDASDEDKCNSCSKRTIKCGGLGCMPCGTSLCPSPVDNTTVSVSGGTGPKYRRVDIDEYGVVTIRSYSANEDCPEMYFLCGGGTTRTCIPSFLVGNGQHDCPLIAGLNSSSDEPLEEPTCPGHYRCYRHAICIHPTYFCDGVYHCPLKDDERYCNLPCPQHCTCEGLAYTCSQMFDPPDHLGARYLDLSRTHEPPLDSLHYLGYLSLLNLSTCGLTKVDHRKLTYLLDQVDSSLTHLRLLDLSNNTLSTLEVRGRFYPALEILKLSASSLQSLDLSNLHRLRQLDIRDNRLKWLVLGKSNASALEILDLSSNELTSVSVDGLTNLTWLDLSNNNLTVITLNNTILPALQFLNLSYCKLNRVSVVGVGRLQVLDLTSNSLTNLTHITFKGLHALIHLNLSRNLLLPQLDVNFQTFLQTAGIVTLQSLFLSNTGIQSVGADPLVGSSCCPHLDITGNDISNVDMNMFTAWTSQLNLLETSSVSVCCAYYYAFPNTTVTCQTPTEIAFPEQCINTALGGKMQYHTAFGISDQREVCDVGWLSFRSLCLRFVFPRQSMSARSVKSECQIRFGASLAALPPITDLATGFLQMSGYQELVVGLEKVSVAAMGLKHYYRFLRQWNQGGVEFRVPRVQASSVDDECTAFCAGCDSSLRFVKCSDLKKYAYVCFKKTLSQTPHSGHRPDPLPRPSRSVTQFPYRVCSDGSPVHTFHPCRQALTWPQSLLGHSVLMHCNNGRYVHYTMVCDGHDDCGDGSDEVNCLGVHFDPHEPASFTCRGQPELVDSRYRCDGIPDCHDGSDEDNCGSCSDGTVLCLAYGCVPEEYANSEWLSCDSRVMHSDRYKPSDVSVETSSLDSNRSLIMASLDAHGFPHLDVVSQCPETHFLCEGELCISSFLVNNGVPDCPLPPADDEAFSSLSCPGYYRCYQSGVCLHPYYLCDDTYHCPLKDDERYCNFSCPTNCTCEGLAYACSVMFDPVVHRHVRYLDLGRTLHPTLGNLTHMVYLSYLNLSSCNLHNVSLFELVHLRVLDVSHNQLTTLTREMLGDMPLLTHFNVSNNPLALFHIGQFVVLLTNARTEQLLHLGLKSTGIKNIEENAFQNMSSLQRIDLRGNEIKGIKKDMFRGLGDLQILETDNPRLCCPYFYVYPNKTMDCRTPIDELSSCSDLLRSDFFRVCLWTLSVMTIIGNIGVVIYRFVLEPQGTSPGFRILVANLCMADFLMGIYMVIIGTADSHYSGQYIWQQEAWTDSALCQTAGFLALLSSEVSAFMICLVTLDRLLVLCFPFSHHLHMTPRFTVAVCGVAWLVGVILAVVPLLPSEWNFYSQTGICLPLPITRQSFPGQQYTFAVFVVLNFILFVLIGAGQLAIFRTIRNTPMASRDSRRKQDMAIARRLFLIVFSDFCCWFPIGLMGLLANHGTPIPGEVNVLAAIFILPVNSALNPFLYTVGMVLEKWFKTREERRIQRTLAKLHTDLASWPDDKLQELMHRTEGVLRSRVTVASKISRPQTLSRDAGGPDDMAQD